MEINKLPIDLKYLFENTYIECMNILIILFMLRNRRKGIEIEEILYYFTLLLMTEVDLQGECHIDETYLQNNYLSHESTIKKSIIILCNQDLIETKTESIIKRNVIYVRITEVGREITLGLENEYYKKQMEKIRLILEVRKFNSKNYRKVLSNNENKIEITKTNYQRRYV